MGRLLLSPLMRSRVRLNCLFLCSHHLFVPLWKRFLLFSISAYTISSFLSNLPMNIFSQCYIPISSFKYNLYSLQLHFSVFLSLFGIFFSSVFPVAPTVVHKDPREQRKTHWNSLYLNNTRTHTHTPSQTH